MTTYIALFEASHKIIQTVQRSCFIWQQARGDVDEDLLKGKIARESSQHYYQLLAGNKHDIRLQDIEVVISRVEVFNG